MYMFIRVLEAMIVHVLMLSLAKLLSEIWTILKSLKSTVFNTLSIKCPSEVGQHTNEICSLSCPLFGFLKKSFFAFLDSAFNLFYSVAYWDSDFSLFYPLTSSLFIDHYGGFCETYLKKNTGSIQQIEKRILGWLL